MDTIPIQLLTAPMATVGIMGEEITGDTAIIHQEEVKQRRKRNNSREQIRRP